jgi:hypothetical protein
MSTPVTVLEEKLLNAQKLLTQWKSFSIGKASHRKSFSKTKNKTSAPVPCERTSRLLYKNKTKIWHPGQTSPRRGHIIMIPDRIVSLPDSRTISSLRRSILHTALGPVMPGIDAPKETFSYRPLRVLPRLQIAE